MVFPSIFALINYITEPISKWNNIPDWDDFNESQSTQGLYWEYPPLTEILQK